MLQETGSTAVGSHRPFRMLLLDSVSFFFARVVKLVTMVRVTEFRIENSYLPVHEEEAFVCLFS